MTKAAMLATNRNRITRIDGRAMDTAALTAG